MFIIIPDFLLNIFTDIRQYEFYLVFVKRVECGPGNRLPNNVSLIFELVLYCFYYNRPYPLTKLHERLMESECEFSPRRQVVDSSIADRILKRT